MEWNWDGEQSGTGNEAEEERAQKLKWNADFLPLLGT